MKLNKLIIRILSTPSWNVVTQNAKKSLLSFFLNNKEIRQISKFNSQSFENIWTATQRKKRTKNWLEMRIQKEEDCPSITLKRCEYANLLLWLVIKSKRWYFHSYTHKYPQRVKWSTCWPYEWKHRRLISSAWF